MQHQPAAAAEEQQQPLQCPRCESHNTKFCYYNNYNLSQPRHFCRDCLRYWTKGGTLRNVPVGGATRKYSKRCRTSTSTTPNPELNSAANDQMLDISGSFTSLLKLPIGGEDPTPSQLESLLSLHGECSWWAVGWPDLDNYNPLQDFSETQMR